MQSLKQTQAPSFKLRDSTDQWVDLNSFKGKWLVIFFYPKDDTPGCTKEACNFRDNYSLIKSIGANIVGISLDGSSSHQKFSAKHGLPFMLLSDPNGNVTKAYGALFQFFCIRLAKRHSFIVDPSGLIRKEYRSVNPATHSDQIIKDLKLLQA
ncbi:Alkyl hydroperoxide reductase/ Thiol specific antioxidant/ Mal allergen [Methylophilales bacterium HTCC2181]|uniref:thioredoxin-dependent peroxiredoxin n=1 Tax=Methylophilales bacterium HTCC2181 TaxID=383631 RepID=A0P665_9PROT|nr:Alkyl hydroperoxide reductase/ Thiol specific antioxidant/ Mal allergen [Methylophilales bacterium HTCC2181]